MAWDKNTPIGTSKISDGDNTIRDNNAQVEAALDLEHNFATGTAQVQTGRHRFDVDTKANLDAPGTAYVDGGIAFSTNTHGAGALNTRPDNIVLFVQDAAVWEAVDVQPLDTGGLPTLPRVDSQSAFTACQFATFETIVTGAGAPRTCAIDLSTSPAKYVIAIDDTIIQNPTNPLANSSTTVLLELMMDAGAPHTITFGSEYRTPAGVAPEIDTTATTGRTVLFITQLNTAGPVTYLVSSSPGLIAIP